MKNYRTECMERKTSEHIQGRTNRRRPVLYPTIQLVVVSLHKNMKFLCYTVVGISLTKNMERKKKEQIQGRTSRRQPFSIQHVIVNLYTKYEVSKRFWRYP